MYDFGTCYDVIKPAHTGVLIQFQIWGKCPKVNPFELSDCQTLLLIYTRHSHLNYPCYVLITFNGHLVMLYSYMYTHMSSTVHIFD